MLQKLQLAELSQLNYTESTCFGHGECNDC